MRSFPVFSRRIRTRLYDGAMATQITLNTEPHGLDSESVTGYYPVTFLPGTLLRKKKDGGAGVRSPWNSWPPSLTSIGFSWSRAFAHGSSLK
jgi:hypothetical protein